MANFIFRPAKTIQTAAVSLAILLLTSRVLGLVRNRLLAGQFGAGAELDVYNASFAVPDFIVDFLITGALTVSFIPVFTGLVVKKKADLAWKVAATIFNLSMAIFLGLALVLIFASPILANILFPGFTSDQKSQVTFLMRLLLISELFLLAGSFLTSVLQSFRHFVIPALAPVVYNLGVIFGLILLAPKFGVTGVVFGVIAGAVAHFLLQLPLAISAGFYWRLNFNHNLTEVREIIKLSIPRAAGVIVANLQWIASLFLASLLVSGSVAVFKFAFDLANFPIGLFGLTVATAALPTLSTLATQGKLGQFKATTLQLLYQIFYLSIPVGVAIGVLRIPIVRLVLGAGLFDWQDTVETAKTLSYFGLGVFAQAGILLTARAFYALKDTTTPLAISLVGFMFHLILSFSLILLFRDVSYLGLSWALAGVLSFLLQLVILNKKINILENFSAIVPFLKMVLASIATGVVLYLPLHLKFEGQYVIDRVIDTTRAANLLLIVVAVTVVGAGFYLVVTYFLGLSQARTIISFFRKFQFTSLVKLTEPISPPDSASR